MHFLYRSAAVENAPDVVERISPLTWKRWRSILRSPVMNEEFRERAYTDPISYPIYVPSTLSEDEETSPFPLCRGRTPTSPKGNSSSRAGREQYAINIDPGHFYPAGQLSFAGISSFDTFQPGADRARCEGGGEVMYQRGETHLHLDLSFAV